MSIREIHIKSLKLQQGAVLAIALIFLVLITIISISSIQTATLQEKMSGNMKDRSLAFQAAESAMRDGEAHVRVLLTGIPAAATACASAAGYCISAVNNEPQNWTVVDWGSSSTSTFEYGDQTLRPDLTKVSQQPRYLIERAVDPAGGGVNTKPKAGSCVSCPWSTGTVTPAPPATFFYFRVTATGFGPRGGRATLQGTVR